MKILMISREYPPLASGGIGTIAYELSLELARRCNDITVITRSNNLNNKLEEGLVKVCRLYSPPIPPKDMWYYALNFNRITRFANAIKPDIVHDVDGSVSHFLPWISRRWRTVVTVHGSPQLSEIRARMGSTEDCLRDLVFRLTHSIPERILTFFIKPNIHAYVFVSRFCLEDFISHIESPELKDKLLAKGKVIYNGVNINELRELKGEGDYDPKSIAFVGRLMEYKGIMFLLKAFKAVVKEVKDARLHIIGNGPLYHNIKDFIHRKDLTKNVLLYGFLPRKGALEILARTGFLVHSSFYEACPLIIAEAYALSKPVISHKAGYALEVVKEVKAGISIDVTNTEEFADAIISLITDKNRYEQLCKNAQKATKRFSINIIAKEYESLFKELKVSS